MKDDVQRYAGRSQTLSENAARVSTLVSMAASDMERATGGEKIPLNDLDRVRETSTAYLRECADNGVLPTVRGCAARLGCAATASTSFHRIWIACFASSFSVTKSKG